MDHLAPPAEQAGAADDRGSHRVEHEGAAIDVVGDRTKPRCIEDPGCACRESGESEGPETVPPQADAAPPGRLGIPADGVEVATEACSAQEERVRDHECGDDHHRPGHSPQDGETAAVRIADEYEDYPGDRRHQHFETGDGERRRYETAGVAAPVPEYGKYREDPHGDHHHDPSGSRAQRAVDQVEDDVVSY